MSVQSSMIDRANSLGGFAPDRFVTGSFNDNLLCSICRYVFDSPVLTPCGHLFCASCLSHWLTACQTLLPSCPECRRTVFAFDVRPVRGLRNYIASLPTYCSLRRAGCNAVLPLDQIQSHEEGCSYRSPANSSDSSPSSTSGGVVASSARTTRGGRQTKTPTSSGSQSSTSATTPQRPSHRTATARTLNSSAHSNAATTTTPSSRSSNNRTVSTHSSTGGATLVVNGTTASTRAGHQQPAQHHVTDHRPNARQRIAMANAISRHQAPLSLNDRVARLEEKLQQVRLDIEAAEQRNVWLETQLALARNNLSLADALRRVRTSPTTTSSSSSNNATQTLAAPITSRRRPAQLLNDD